MPNLARPALATVGILALALLAGCATPAPGETPTETPAVDAEPTSTLVLTAPELDAEGYLPDSARGDVAPYCDGENVSPLLEWTGVPEGTQSFALLMTDPNYPSYFHWVVTGIPADATSLPATPAGQVEVGIVGTNSRGAGNYVGPCQPDNGYRYTLYALDEVIAGDASTTMSQAEDLIDGHILAEAYVTAMRRATP